MINSIMERQVFFIQLSFRMIFVLFLRKRLLRLLCSLLCYLFMQENVQTDTKGTILRSSGSQMFFKISAFKNLAIFATKHLSWRLFFIRLLKKGHQHIFLRILKTFQEQFFIENLLWTSMDTKLIFFIFFVPLLCFLPELQC